MIAKRRIAIGLGVAIVLASSAVASLYGRQIWSFAGHIRGSPTKTAAWVPYPPGEGPALRVAVAGDVGYGNDRERRTAQAMAITAGTDPYDVLLLLGDNVYPSGDPARLPVTVFEPFAPVLDTGTELLAILGNHDVKAGNTEAHMAALGIPGRWWARQVGDVTFVALDSNDPFNPDQRAWLERTLAAVTTTWKIVAVHHPPYSAGYQGSSLETREQFSPLFERYGVQLVLSGHEHDYQRSYPINGVTYVVSGAAADTRRSGKDDFTATSASWHHFVDLGVFEDHLLLRAVNQSGRVLDEVTIPAAHPPH